MIGQAALEAPHQRALAEAEAINDWCADNEEDPDDPGVRDRALDAMIDAEWDGIIAEHERLQDVMLDDYYSGGMYP